MASFTGNQSVGSALSGTTLSATITAPANGNVLVASIGIASKTSVRSVSGITTTGVVWARKNSIANGLNVVEIWFGTVGASAGTALSITISGTNNGSGCNIAEFSGVNPIDDAGSGVTSTGSGTSATTGAPSFATAGSIGITVASFTGTNAAQNPGGTANYTRLTPATYNANNSEVCAAYLLGSAAGSQSTETWDFSATGGTITWATTFDAIQAAAANNWLQGGYWWQRATESSGSF